MTPEYLNILFAVYAFLWGAVWGSFLNVVIWRLPEGMSLTRPPSHCPKCQTPIKWYDNVPVLGWLWLRGKCRACSVRISIRYPAIELFVALLTLGIWMHVSAGGVLESEPIQVVLIPFFLHFFFVALLVSIAFIDLDHTIIPHELTIPGMVWGLASALMLPKTGLWMYYFPSVDIVDSAIGLVAGIGFIVIVFYGYAAATGRVGLGGGDATMLGMIGANLGWQSLLFVLLFAALQGLATAVVLFFYERIRGTEGDESAFLRGAHRPEFWDEDDDGATGSEPEAPPDDTETTDGEDGFMKLALPFGPFLALAAVEYLFIGEPILRWFTAGTYP